MPNEILNEFSAAPSAIPTRVRGCIRTGHNTPKLRHPTPLFEHEDEDDYDWFQALRALGWLQMERGSARVQGAGARGES
jgi:hypothetical protein